MKITIFSILCLVLTACTTLEPNRTAASLRSPTLAEMFPYPLDAHVHYSFGYPPGTSGQDIFLKQGKFAHAFLIAPTYLIADVPKLTPTFIANDRNESLIPIIHKEVSNFVIGHPGRFTGVCGINLNWNNVKERTIECLRMPGMRGINLHSNNSGLDASLPKYRKKLEATLASTAAMRPFVIWHMAFEGEVKLVYDLARQFPEVIFIVAHAGIGLDVKQWVTWMKSDGPLENLWMDVALSWDPQYHSAFSDDYLKSMFNQWRKFGFDRIVFGSDIIGDNSMFSESSSSGLQWLGVFESQELLTVAERKAVLIDNPQRLLQLLQINSQY